MAESSDFRSLSENACFWISHMHFQLFVGKSLEAYHTERKGQLHPISLFRTMVAPLDLICALVLQIGVGKTVAGMIFCTV